jgi:hypothetical protein
MQLWRASLTRLLGRYDAARKLVLFPWFALFFVSLNLACYWLAIFSAFPELCRGARGVYYFGIVIGVSATLPTAVHVFLFLKSVATAGLVRLFALPAPAPLSAGDQ